jgi:hypothetical protein
LNLALEYDIRKVQEFQVGLKFNGTHQFLVYVDDVNLLGDNIDTIKKNAETCIGANKEVDLEVNVEKSKYMLLSRHQNAVQNHNIKQLTDLWVLRRIFGPQRDDMTGGWRKLHNEELHNLYSSTSIMRMIMSRRI